MPPPFPREIRMASPLPRLRPRSLPATVAGAFPEGSPGHQRGCCSLGVHKIPLSWTGKRGGRACHQHRAAWTGLVGCPSAAGCPAPRCLLGQGAAGAGEDGHGLEAGARWHRSGTAAAVLCCSWTCSEPALCQHQVLRPELPPPAPPVAVSRGRRGEQHRAPTLYPLFQDSAVPLSRFRPFRPTPRGSLTPARGSCSVPWCSCTYQPRWGQRSCPRDAAPARGGGRRLGRSRAAARALQGLPSPAWTCLCSSRSSSQ